MSLKHGGSKISFNSKDNFQWKIKKSWKSETNATDSSRIFSVEKENFYLALNLTLFFLSNPHLRRQEVLVCENAGLSLKVATMQCWLVIR